MDSFRDLLGQWPSLEALAHDVGATTHRVSKWRIRDRVPSEYWQALLEGAERRGIPVTPEILIALSNRQRDSTSSESTAA